MSSDEEERAQNLAPKRIKGHRPCDMCRRKKRRCDGGEPCGHCVKHGFNCTYQMKAIIALKRLSYVNILETRLKTVEALLRESNIVQTAGSPHSSDGAMQDTQGPGVQIVTQVIRRLTSPFPVPHSDDFSFHNLAESLESLSIDNPGSRGFQGKSSQAMLVKAAVDLKSQTASSPAVRTVVPPPSKPWAIKPWEHITPPRDFNFPSDDLMISLISLYFDNVNTFFPVLHRPTFETAFARNTHWSDNGFGGTLLLVCALGARYSDDPRVHLPGLPFGTAGWKWFDQVKLSLCGQPTLYDLQSYCLSVQFLDRTSGPRAAWTLVGFGIRLAQDVGAHRQKLRTRTITPEEELEKRVYWSMVVFDTQLSTALGRSIAIQAHDFDLDLPLRCDDEYWVASPLNAAFHQPRNKPSLIDYLNCQLNLNRIISFILKILYSTNRMKGLIGMNDEGWEEKVVMEFDSALNTWLDSVPAHLRWDPARKPDVFFDQSAALYCNYYLTQILIHRPFIPAMRSSTDLKSFPSLTICNNAARACSHVAEIQHQRRPNNPLPFGQTAVFTAGIVLLLNIWGGNRGGRVQDADLSDVHRCMGVLRGYNERWPSTDPLLDTLEQLVKVDHVPHVPTPHAGTSSNHDSSSQHSDAGAGAGAHSTFDWPAYDPVLETAREEYEAMINHFDGPGEAPTRAPNLHSGGLGYAGAPSAESTSSFPSNSSFPAMSFTAPAGTTQHYLENPETVAIWSVAPSSFEVSDWDVYLNSVMMQTDHHPLAT
ncbi:fungal-specific transcription factor domain-containing protein [Mycena capillaripes]|nr:fungal-specific transcription factor domain-containing protein [Mycena capillaripes]